MRRLLLVLALVMPALVLAREPRCCDGANQQIDVSKLPGSWRPYSAKETAMPYDAPPWLTAAQAEAMRANLAAVADVFRRTPLLAAPIGFTIFPKRQLVFDQRAWAHPTHRDRRWPLQGKLSLSASVFGPDGKTVYDTGTAFVVNASANDLQCVFDGASPWGADSAGTMYLEPAVPTDTMHGFPAYRYCVLITHRTSPFFVPVSEERVLGVRIVEADAKVAEWKPFGGELYDTWQRIAASLRAQLAAMSAADRKAPASVTEKPDYEHPLAAGRGGRKVVEANPAFFDASRPTDMQVLTMFDGCVTNSCAETEIVQKLHAQLDWRALAALVK